MLKGVYFHLSLELFLKNYFIFQIGQRYTEVNSFTPHLVLFSVKFDCLES